jgi:hypothetical protein
LLTMYCNNSIGRSGASPSWGNGKRFCATSIKLRANDHTSEAIVYGSPRIRSGWY